MNNYGNACMWFRCDEDAAIGVLGVDIPQRFPLASIGSLCVAHYDELRQTLALYALGNAKRRDRAPMFTPVAPIVPDGAMRFGPAPMPHDPEEWKLPERSEPDHNRCTTCGHTGSAHAAAYAPAAKQAFCNLCASDGMPNRYHVYVSGFRERVIVCDMEAVHVGHIYVAAGLTNRCPGREYAE